MIETGQKRHDLGVAPLLCDSEVKLCEPKIRMGFEARARACQKSASYSKLATSSCGLNPEKPWAFVRDNRNTVLFARKESAKGRIRCLPS